MNIPTSTEENASWRMRKPSYLRTSAEDERTYQKRVIAAKRMGQIFSLLPPVVLALLLLAIWSIGTTSGQISSLILPAPADVLDGLRSGLTSGLYFSNTWVTVQESVLGFLIAVLVALPIGYGIAKSRLLANAIQPYLAAGQAIPAIVIAPLLVLWLGYGLLPNMLVCMLVVIFPMVINTVLGIQTIDRLLIDAARVEGASGWSLLSNIEFPLALPSILAAIRTGFTLSITGALVAEFVGGGDAGLGSLVLQALHQYNTAFMFATLVVLAVLAALYYGATWLLVKLASVVY
ncbi:ABC transporter permease [Ktedonosporobacter rubrisoli]|nr:ABC transporter permease [Ktedonosporobacter rubrisoli]